MNWKAWIVEKLGGFPSIDSAIEAISREDSDEKHRILTLAVKKIFNTIGSDDILKQGPSGAWLFQGKELADGQKKLLQAEATQFEETMLWKILQADIKYQANRKMFLLAKSEEDIVAGKLWIYTLDAIRTRISSMRSGSPIFNNKK